jgi:hypothetical protein
MAYTDVGFFPSDFYSGIAIKEIQQTIQTGYTSEGIFIDSTTQSGSPVDVPKTVMYGANKNSDTNLVNYTDGIFTALVTGPFAFKSRIRAGRTGGSGSSHLFFWVEASVNGGSTWNVLGTPVDLRLDNANDNAIFFDYSPLMLVQGLKLRTRFARSSSGSNSGDLVPSSPSTVLQTYGILPAPSAQITVYRRDGYVY